MRRRWLLLSLIALASESNATQTNYRGVRPGEVLRGRFVQERQMQGFDHPLTSTGEFVLSPDKGLIWRTVQPFAMTTMITAAGLVQDVGGSETTRLSSTRLPFLASLYEILSAALTGNVQPLAARFDVAQQGDERQWELSLTPRKGSDPTIMPFQSITLSGGQFLDAVQIQRSDGDKDQMKFLDQKLDPAGLSVAEAAQLHKASQ